MSFRNVQRVVVGAVLIAIGVVGQQGRAQVSGLTGTLVVVNKSVSTATIIDVGSGRVLATLPTGPGPHEVARSSDGMIAVVTDYVNPTRDTAIKDRRSRTLTVIDVAARKVARTIDLGQHVQPHGIQFLPGDSLVVVSTEGSGHIVIANVLRGTVVNAIATQGKVSHMVAATADGSRAYTSNIGSHTVSEIDLRSGKFVRTFDVPEQPEAINVTPDGKEVWLGSNRTGKVLVLDPSTGAVTTAAEGFKFPYRVLFTPDLKTVLLPDAAGEELRVLDRASRRELARIPLEGADPQGITITPDGRYVFQSLNNQAKIAIIDLAARKVVGYLNAGEAPDGIGYVKRVFVVK